MEKVTNYIQIKPNPKPRLSPEGDFFKVWVAFLKPIHDLTKKEMEVLAAYLQERYRINKKVKDLDIVDNILLSNKVRKTICKQCGIKPKYLNVILSKFRKNGVIRNEKLFLNLIPSIDKDGARLMINFSFKDEQQFVKLGPQANSKKS